MLDLQQIDLEGKRVERIQEQGQDSFIIILMPLIPFQS